MEHQELYINIRSIISYAITIVTYILGGVAYKYLLGNYMGFIPIFGDIICKYKIASEYDNPYKKRFLIFALLSFVAPIVIVIMYFVFIFFSGLADGLDGFAYIMLSTLVGAITFLIFWMIYVYYNYKIIYPLIVDITSEEKVGITTFIFSVFPIVFYIWLIVKNRKIKKEV